MNVKTDGLATKTEALVVKTDGLEKGLATLTDNMNEQFKEVRNDLKVIRIQTAHVTERVTKLENTQQAKSN